MIWLEWLDNERHEFASAPPVLWSQTPATPGICVSPEALIVASTFPTELVLRPPTQSAPSMSDIGTHLNAEARRLPLLRDGALPASSTEHIGADLGFASWFLLKYRS